MSLGVQGGDAPAPDPAARIADLWADLGATVVVLKASQAALYALAKACLCGTVGGGR